MENDMIMLDKVNFEYLRTCGLKSTQESLGQEDIAEAEKLCEQMIGLINMAPDARNLLLGDRPIPNGYRNVRFRNGQTGEMYGEVFRIDGGAVAVKCAVIWIAAEEYSLGKLISIRRGPTIDEGYLELFLQFDCEQIKQRH